MSLITESVYDSLIGADCGTGRSSSDTCEITCSNSNDLRGAPIHCGDAGHCIINCTQKRCLRESTINATLASTLQITATRQECLRASSIYFPINGNVSIIIDTEGTNLAHGIAKQANLYSQSSDHIDILCKDPLRDQTSKDECSIMNIHAQDASFLSVSISGAEFKSSAQIHCPLSSIYHPSCVVNATNALQMTDGVMVFIGNGSMPNDLLWYTGNNTDYGSGDTRIKVICSEGISGINETSNSFVNVAPCWKPLTFSPTTIAPTNTPTAAPLTASPTTTKLTTQPTTSPTTIQPTKGPTAAPLSTSPTTTQLTTRPTTAPITSSSTTTQPTTGPLTASPTTIQPTAAPMTSSPTTTQPTISTSRLEPITIQPTISSTSAIFTNTLSPTTAVPSLSTIDIYTSGDIGITSTELRKHLFTSSDSRDSNEMETQTAMSFLSGIPSMYIMIGGSIISLFIILLCIALCCCLFRRYRSSKMAAKSVELEAYMSNNVSNNQQSYMSNNKIAGLGVNKLYGAKNTTTDDNYGEHTTKSAVIYTPPIQPTMPSHAIQAAASLNTSQTHAMNAYNTNPYDIAASYPNNAHHDRDTKSTHLKAAIVDPQHASSVSKGMLGRMANMLEFQNINASDDAPSGFHQAQDSALTNITMIVNDKYNPNMLQPIENMDAYNNDADDDMATIVVNDTPSVEDEDLDEFEIDPAMLAAPRDTVATNHEAVLEDNMLPSMYIGIDSEQLQVVDTLTSIIQQHKQYDVNGDSSNDHDSD